MKKTALAIVPLLIGAAIGFFVCKEYFCPKIDCTTCEVDCTKCPEQPGPCAPTTEAPSGIISIAEAVRLHETYAGERYQAANQLVDKNFLDTQFVWFEYDRIKQYIGYLEAVEQKNTSNPPISGIRVYFGAHDANNDEYANQQTVFFTPTVDTKLNEQNTNMKHLPFYIQPNGDDPLVGKYKVIGRLLIDQYNPDERWYLANANLGHKGQDPAGNVRQKMAQKSANTENGDGDDDGTSLSLDMGQLSPPPRN
ncbi:MAG: hypothetical protein AAF611_05645 [Bacteroidota bacterium]